IKSIKSLKPASHFVITLIKKLKTIKQIKKPLTLCEINQNFTPKYSLGCIAKGEKDIPRSHPFLPSENKRLSVCNIEQHSLQIDNNMHLQDTIYYVRQ
ncbi:TPA: hypothetical protein ACHUQZ_002583, partial [Shigella flexneri]